MVTPEFSDEKNRGVNNRGITATSLHRSACIWLSLWRCYAALSQSESRNVAGHHDEAFFFKCYTEII